MAKTKKKIGVNRPAGKRIQKKSTTRENNTSGFRPDTRQSSILIKAGRVGAAKAIRASKALGLSITYMEDGVVYREHPGGEKEVIAKAEIKEAGPTPPLKKGMILHAKK